jgi:nucleotide-binding universal stress UspA family protein
MTTISNILVPTDFSKNAQAAFLYALDLATQFNASVQVIHVYLPLENGELVHFDDVAIGKLKKRLQAFVADNIEEEAENGTITLRKTKVNAEVVYGEAINTIVDWSKRDYDMVVMGSKSGGDLMEIFFGSVTTGVAQKAYCPVLVVPEESRFHKIKKLLYACDFKHKSFKHPLLIADVAFLFKSKLDVVFVEKKEDTSHKDQQDIDDLKMVFSKQAPELKVEVFTTVNDDVYKGVQDFAEKHKTDMIVMMTSHKTFLEKLFHVSATKEIAMYTHLPLLVLKSKD